MTRLHKLKLGILLCSLLGALHAEDKPNILFLFTDDQRFDTIHALGNERIKTPNIDRLVKSGTSFSNAHNMGGTCMAVCTPSRAALFSGRTLWNLETQGDWDFAIPPKFKTMAEALREGDYTTFTSGKNDPAFGKNDHFLRSFEAGDNIYYRGGHRGQNQTPVYPYPADGILKRENKKKSDGTFNADLFADACISYLEERSKAEGERKPFFAYISFMTPHDPLNCPDEYMEMYSADDMKLPDNYMAEHPFDAGVHHIRDEKLMKRPLTEDGMRDRLAKYYALVTHTDVQIGRILEALDKSGEADNTIIVFSSDNGLALGSHGLMGKQNVYQHAVKLPLIISGPGIPKGETRDQLCYIYDIFPTLCDLSGIKIPETVQYKSLKPIIDDGKAKHHDSLYFSFMQWQRAVRDERYKLIEYSVDGKSHTQLFDLKEDPAEMNNLADREDMEPKLERMRELLLSEKEAYNDGGADAPHIKKMSDDFWNTYRLNIE